jgi:hypothetical protein
MRWYYHDIEEQKRVLLHQKFRYTTGDDPYAVTTNGKLFFHTQTDLNRHAYFQRVMICKIVKYLTIKKLAFCKEAIRRWKSSIYDFNEKDLINTHIHTDLLALDYLQAGANRNKSIEEIKDALIDESEAKLLKYLLSENNDVGHTHQERFLFRSEDEEDGNASQGNQQVAVKKSSSTTGVDLTLFDDYSYDNIGTFPLKINRNPKTNLPYLNPNLNLVKNYPEYVRKNYRNRRNYVDEDQLLQENTETPQIYLQGSEDQQITDSTTNKSFTDEQQSEIDNDNKNSAFQLPGYNPSEDLPLPLLPTFARPKTFKDRLYYDISQQAATAHHPVTIPQTEYHNPMLMNQSQGEFMLYRNQLEGPTSESYWLIPGMFMVGNAPFGSALKKTFDQIPVNFLETLAEMNKSSDGTIINKFERANTSKRWSVKSTELTAVAALLLSGIDTFVSVLSKEDENILENYYQSQSVETMLKESLEQTKVLSNKIIAENLVLIQKQEKLLHAIPNFGKSDPRFQQAYQEKLRCQGRITLYQNTITTIKNQIKLLPKQIYFYQLGNISNSIPNHDLTSIIPWNSAKIMTSVWFLEELLRKNHCIYLYSGSFLHEKDDGPTKDGLSGTLATIVMGRLYHMKGSDAIFQWQKSHDFMKILQLHSDKQGVNPFVPDDQTIAKNSKTNNNTLSSSSLMLSKSASALSLTSDHNNKKQLQKASAKPLPLSKTNPSLYAMKEHAAHLIYRTSCPPLAWQKTLIIESLDKSHQWIDYPIIRSQLTPEIFTVLERNHYDVTMRNSNAYLNDLKDYYTSQSLVTVSQNNTPHYFNQNTKNPYTALKEQQIASGGGTNSKTISSKRRSAGITIRGDPMIPEDEEEGTEMKASGQSSRPISTKSKRTEFILPSTSSLSSNPAELRKGSLFDSLVDENARKTAVVQQLPQPTTTGRGGRMSMIQKMKAQVVNEDIEEQLRKEKEKAEKDQFDSKEFQEAQRQEKIILDKSVYRLKQSHYQNHDTAK